MTKIYEDYIMISVSGKNLEKIKRFSKEGMCMKMKKLIAMLLAMTMTFSLAACGDSGDEKQEAAADSSQSENEAEEDAEKEDAETNDGEVVELTMWFWGADEAQQAALAKNLVDPFNESHPGYNMTVEYRSSVNKDMAVALAADEGPDIVYESSGSLALTYIEAGKYANLDAYAEKYGWQEKLLGCMYDSGVYNGSLYTVPMGMSAIGMVYNKAVLEENGWEVPATVDELTAIMDEAMEKGMYASVTGNKGWQPTNEDYTSLFLNSWAGADKVYAALTDEAAWTDEALVGAIEASAEWYEKGYLCSDYMTIGWGEAAGLLATGQSPFYFGPLRFIQNLMPYDVGDNIGFTVFPSVGDQPATYTVGASGLLAINENCEHKDVCAEFLDMLMSNDFVESMANDWPGYWAVPLTTLGDIDVAQFEGLSKTFVEGMIEACKAIDAGNFGYYNSAYMPAEAFDLMCVVDAVWMGEKDAQTFMQEIDDSFQKDYDAGNVPICPARD